MVQAIIWQKTLHYCKIVRLTNSVCCFMRQDNRLLHWHCWLGSYTKGNRRKPPPPPGCFLCERPLTRFDPFFRPSGHTEAFVQTRGPVCSTASHLLSEGSRWGGLNKSQVISTPAPAPPTPVPFPVPARHTQLRHRPPQLLVQHALLSRAFIWNAKRGATGGSVSPQIKSFSDAYLRGGVCFFRLMHKALALHHTFYRFVSCSSRRLLTLPPSPPHHTDRRHVLLYCVNHSLPANCLPSAASVSPPLTLR